MLHYGIGGHQAYIHRKIYLWGIEFCSWLRPRADCKLRARFASPPKQQRLFSVQCYTLNLVNLLSGLPIFTKVPPSRATPVQRTTYQVVCQAEGFPPPLINWRRVGMPLPAGRTEVNQGTLTIKNLTAADSGLYECIATNTMGTKRARTNVTVKRKPGMLFCFTKESFW